MSAFTLVCIFIGPVLAIVTIVSLMKKLGGDQKEIERILQIGVPAQARVLDLQHTGSSVSFGAHRHLVLMLGLEVHPQGGAPYHVRCQQTVSELQIPSLQPGAWLQVRVDPANPQKLAIAGAGALQPGAYGAPGMPPMQPGAYGAPGMQPGMMGMPGMPMQPGMMGMPGGVAGWGAAQTGAAMNKAFSRAIWMTAIISIVVTVPLLAVFVDWSSIVGGEGAPKGGYCKALVRCCKQVHGAAGQCDSYANLPAAGCETAYEAMKSSGQARGKTCD